MNNLENSGFRLNFVMINLILMLKLLSGKMIFAFTLDLTTVVLQASAVRYPVILCSPSSSGINTNKTKYGRQHESKKQLW